MLNIESTSKLSPEEAIKQAEKFFGPEGYGLTIKERGPGYIELEGGGGGVAISATPREKGANVSFVSREWDYQIKEFLGKIK